jgi:hypothetical protein
MSAAVTVPGPCFFTLGAVALHLDGDILDVEHDVGDIFRSSQFAGSQPPIPNTHYLEAEVSINATTKARLRRAATATTESTLFASMCRSSPRACNYRQHMVRVEVQVQIAGLRICRARLRSSIRHSDGGAQRGGTGRYRLRSHVHRSGRHRRC